MVSEPCGGVQPQPHRRSIGELTRDEILWDFRTALEAGHRHDIHLRGVMLTYMPSVRDVNRLPEMTVSDFLDTCNKSVPIYIRRGPQWRLLSTVLHNYIYRRWFRPYRNEIERERFICKFITPKDLVDEASPSQSTIDSIASMNRAICAEVEARRRIYDEQLASGDEEVMDCKFHVLQPLFRALLIIISSKIYNNEDSETVGRLPVFLVCTGVEDGLSAPITFEPIADKIDGYVAETRSAVKTTLETAIDFVMDLEAREAAVFGLQPNPIAAWNPNKVIEACWRKLGGSEPLIGPSSLFVDTEKYPQWSGEGERYDSWIMAEHERRAFRFEAKRIAGELG